MLIYGQVTSQPVTYVRELESGTDIRITESDDVRITNDVLRNTIEGSLVANATYIPWRQEIYTKQLGSWIKSDPYVKYAGTWQQPTRIYKKISGDWKRIY
jgi:hypothetical protein